jgi:hypothetical protein
MIEYSMTVKPCRLAFMTGPATIGGCNRNTRAAGCLHLSPDMKRAFGRDGSLAAEFSRLG